MEVLNQTKVVIRTVVTIFALLILFFSFTIVTAGTRAVVLRLGSVNRVMDTGLHFKMPFIESVKKLDVRTQKEQVDADSASADLQTVKTTVALNYHLEPDRVGDLWANIGSDYKSRIVDPLIQESIKAATANYTAEELITKRELVKDEMKASLEKKLGEHFINVDDLSIVNFDFSPSFNAAIEAKVTAEQQALAAKNKLEQVKFEAEQRVTQAQAEAKAIQIQAQAITQQGGQAYVDLKAVEKWDGKLPQQFVPNASLPFLNLNK